MNTDAENFVRALFGFISFGLTTGLILYGVFVHNWWIVIADICGALGAAIGLALKK